MQQQRPDLDDAQAWEVLQAVEHDHDCNYGITWNTLSMAAEHLFPVHEAIPSNFYTDGEGGYNYFLDSNGTLMASPFSLAELLSSTFEFDQYPGREFDSPPLSDQERQRILAALAEQADTRDSSSLSNNADSRRVDLGGASLPSPGQIADGVSGPDLSGPDRGEESGTVASIRQRNSLHRSRHEINTKTSR